MRKILISILTLWLTFDAVTLKSQTLINNDSIKFVGLIEDGKKNGSWIYYDSLTKNVKQICYYNKGQLHGACYLFDNNILTLKINFENGIINDKVYFYSKDGDIIAIYKYTNGIRSEILYYIAGKDSPSRNHIYSPKNKVIF